MMLSPSTASHISGKRVAISILIVKQPLQRADLHHAAVQIDLDDHLRDGGNQPLLAISKRMW